MNVTINLNDEFTFGTIKIRDEPAHRSLSSEFESAKLPTTQTLPKNFLGGRYFFS